MSLPESRIQRATTAEDVEVALEFGEDIELVEGIFEQTALHVSCEKGRLEVADCLLRHGANVNALDAEKRTALMLASGEGHTEVVKLLLRQPGIKVNDFSDLEQSALSCACRRGRSEVVRALLEHGADVNASVGKRTTALMEACGTGKIEIIDLLISHGADVNALNFEGMAAIM
eukprot:TRINITY_DN12012_c0_g1_i1.p1 TRINITY_DN12012_c0_g1~~TRINITY_DN12012_c0_g1_i1.p1  ORF type:complete len:191 (+),score=49.57 TRINITY_DN12012_c0_g1_i1:53-574(+)